MGSGKPRVRRCAHCERYKLARFIEWHPGIEEWQCRDFEDCDKAIEALYKRRGA